MTKTKTIRLQALNRFEEHLFNILPLYSVSHSDERNQVIAYSMKVLADLGRTPILDKHYNIIADSVVPSDDRRCMVAHTDTVGSLEPAATHQSIRYNSDMDIIYNRSNRRAMGGDDKVGVAIALTVAEFIPWVHVLLVADEEVGCIGSSQVEVEAYDFCLQFDRRGAIDLVNEIFGKLATAKTTKAALSLLPHRRQVSGMITDVGTLVERGIAKCAFNMSCGYYEPHYASEYIVLSEAFMSMNDAITLMLGLSIYDFEPVDRKAEYSRYRGMYNESAYWGSEWEGVEYEDNSNWEGWKKSVKNGVTTFEPSVKEDGVDVVVGPLKKALSGNVEKTDEPLSGYAMGLPPSLNELYQINEEADDISEDDVHLVDVRVTDVCAICAEFCDSGQAYRFGAEIVCEDCKSTFDTATLQVMLGYNP